MPIFYIKEPKYFVNANSKFPATTEDHTKSRLSVIAIFTFVLWNIHSLPKEQYITTTKIMNRVLVNIILLFFCLILSI